MKRTDLEKNMALKLDSRLKLSGTPERFAGGAMLDRKGQRKLDQAKGLIPFAVKLDAQLAEEIRAQAMARQMGLNELVGELLRKGLIAGV
ncbi:MAG: hypothetical protein KKF85_15830 [Gammaproteobacteria bacterium]|nr:hypothetical protein [Rhodocyclaceae bacterium]MBU3909012.1 hypothetical protein [Gammaproteobacteria bacterium]MBU4003769.1 hypothetical protein [Gammaproteobacteria bacterium]MBU4021647.1 hypothetical protein [Gammaproteobacteria bacterium]MBU4094911.1 hypothetical protein [Gammaproteobacteria bacterium]